MKTVSALMSLKRFPINMSAAVYRQGLLAQLDERAGAALRNNDDILSVPHVERQSGAGL